MDRAFMKLFCQNYYADFQTEAVKNSEEYQEKRSRRYDLENKIELALQEYGKEVVGLIEQYLDAYADEQEILLQEMYLMGAQDREKMLCGII